MISFDKRSSGFEELYLASRQKEAWFQNYIDKMNKFVFALILAPTPSETRTWTLDCEASPLTGPFPQNLVDLSTRKAYLYSFLGMGMLCFRFPREHLRPIHAACTAEVTASVQKSRPTSRYLNCCHADPIKKPRTKRKDLCRGSPCSESPA